MTCTVYGLQCTKDVPVESVSAMASYYIQVILQMKSTCKFLYASGIIGKISFSFFFYFDLSNFLILLYV